MRPEKAANVNQRRRTRKDLLQAAARLLKEGRTPTLEEIAEAALVSRATAYRYFSGADALLHEAVLDLAVPEPGALFAGDAAPDAVARDAAPDAVARLARVDAALHDVVVNNETAIRTMLMNTIGRAIRGGGAEDYPPRQNRRSPLIDAALEPVHDEFDPAALETLKQALALIVGTEAMIAFRDVLRVDDARAREVKLWAIEALVAAARKHGGK